MLNVHETTSPRIFAVVALTVYLRSAVAALLAVVAVFIASRRLAGALETPLGPFYLLVAGLGLTGLARIAHAPAQANRFRAGGAPITLALLAIAVSLSVPGSNLLALFGFWALIVGEELWVWRSVLPARRTIKGDLPIAPRHAPPPANGALSEEIESKEPAADILQQLTLRATAEGGQELSGWLRMPLAAGQRTGSLHVVFCPSFAQMPRVQAEAVSGPDCRIKAAQVLPYGARLDVKLAEPAGADESVLVWFFARNDG